MVEATNELLPRTPGQMQGTSGEPFGRFDAVAGCSERLCFSVDEFIRPLPTASRSAGYVNLSHLQVATRRAVVGTWSGTHQDLQRRVTHLEQAR